MTELKIKIFRFNAINPDIIHTDDTRLDLPAESSYFNAHM